MSDELKIPNEITFEYLHDVVKYHELQPLFKELGVHHVWNQKNKKKENIDAALKALAKIKEIKKENPNLAPEEVQEKLNLATEQELEQENKDLILQEQGEALKEKENLKLVKEKKMSEEDIIKNINNIDKNLSMNIAGQRDILLKKRGELQKVLEEIQGK